MRAESRDPRGFRGPGFSLSAATLRVLERRGYIYDASTFPTFLGPLARAYYFMTAKLSKEEIKEIRKSKIVMLFHPDKNVNNPMKAEVSKIFQFWDECLGKSGLKK